MMRVIIVDSMPMFLNRLFAQRFPVRALGKVDSDSNQFTAIEMIPRWWIGIATSSISA